MSSRHGGQSMSHPIITLYLVWCFSYSNSWSSLLVLNRSFIENETKFQILYNFLNFEIKNLSFLARVCDKTCSLNSSGCSSLGFPSYKENEIHSIRLVSFPLLLQVVVEYYFFLVGYTLWCLLLVLVVSFSYSILLKSWGIFLCASSCVVFLFHATFCFCFVVSFRTFG
jgi:hypothetical protein